MAQKAHTNTEAVGSPMFHQLMAGLEVVPTFPGIEFNEEDNASFDDNMTTGDDEEDITQTFEERPGGTSSGW